MRINKTIESLKLEVKDLATLNKKDLHCTFQRLSLIYTNAV